MYVEQWLYHHAADKGAYLSKALVSYYDSHTYKYTQRETLLAEGRCSRRPKKISSFDRKSHLTLTLGKNECKNCRPDTFFHFRWCLTNHTNNVLP